MTLQSVPRLLDSIRAVLQAAHEDQWIPAIDQMRVVFKAAEPGTPQYQEAIRTALGLFGGMGSFQDLVLQDDGGVLPQQRELSTLQHELFSALQDALK